MAGKRPPVDIIKSPPSCSSETQRELRAVHLAAAAPGPELLYFEPRLIRI